MAASRLNFPAIEKGATYRHTLTWLQPDEITPVNLTGCTAKAQVRETVNSATALVELSTENGRITITPLLGKFSFYISDEDTASLSGLGGVYDLEVYFTNGDTVRLTQGKWAFSPEVTHG